MAVKCTLLPQIALGEVGKIAYGLNCKDYSTDLMNSYITYLDCEDICALDCEKEICINKSKTYFTGCRSIPRNLYVKLTMDDVQITVQTDVNCVDEDGFPTGTTLLSEKVSKLFYVEFYEDENYTVPVEIKPDNLKIYLEKNDVEQSSITIGNNVTVASRWFIGQFEVSGIAVDAEECETEAFFNYYTLTITESSVECFKIVPPGECLAPSGIIITIENAS